MNKFKKPLLFLSIGSLAVVLMLILTVPALAEVVGGDPNAIINEDMDDDLFINGDLVEINSTINGDVFASGNNVVINGTVKGNLIVAGQYLHVKGNIEGSVVAAGLEFEVEEGASIQGSLYYAGFSLFVDEGANIRHSLYMSGYQTEIAGHVHRDTDTTSASFNLTGQVDGDVRVMIDDSDAGDRSGYEYWKFMDTVYNLQFNDPGLYIDEDAVVNGEVYPKVTTLDTEIPDHDTITINGAELISPDNWGPKTVGISVPDFGFSVLKRIGKLVGETVGFVLIGLLFVFFGKDLLDQTAENLNKKLLPDFGWGLVVLVISPFVFLFLIFVLVVVGLLLSLVTLGTISSEFVGIAFSAFMLVSGIFSLGVWWLSKLVVSYWVGRKLVDLLLPKIKDTRWGYFWAIFFGALIYGLIRFIPILGGIFAAIVIIFGVGAIFDLIRGMIRKPEKAAA